MGEQSVALRLRESWLGEAREAGRCSNSTQKILCLPLIRRCLFLGRHHLQVVRRYHQSLPNDGIGRSGGGSDFLSLYVERLEL